MVKVNPAQGAARPAATGNGSTTQVAERLGFGVDTHHPDYDDILPDWELIRDAIDGESTVKNKGDIYLPKPDGFTVQPDKGESMYRSYILRAKFPEIMGPTLRGMAGIIHRIEADIQLPEQLEPLRESATKDGLSLSALHQRITYELLAMGRFGLLVDMPEDGQTGDMPYIVGYSAETIINWDELYQDFYVLDESHLDRIGFAWQESPQFRVLKLSDEEEDENGKLIEGSGGVYQQVLYSTEAGGSLQEQDAIEPQMQGGQAFDDIPFVIIGSTDVTPELDEIPLIGVVRCAFTLYRLFADYYWQLFMSGQETLFVSSESQQDITTVGAGVVINLPPNSDAKYVGPAGTGIAAHRTALIDERDEAMIQGARIFDTEKKSAESGEALKMRWAAQTASLTTIAINSAKGLEKALKYAAMFIGADPEEVVIEPNLSFIDTTLDPQKAVYLMQLYMGGVLSGESLWENLQRGEIGTYERTWEEERELIDREMPDIQAQQGLGAGGQPKGSGININQRGLAGGTGGAATPRQNAGGGNGAGQQQTMRQQSRFVEDGQGLVFNTTNNRQ